MTALHDLFNWAPLGLPAYVFLLTLVVFIHELGHFSVARWCGVKVETFSIGFGPALLSWTDRKGTRWKISCIPFGSFVRFFGDADASSTPDREQANRMTAEERRVAFPYKSLPQRAAIVAAGPVANFLLAIVIFTGIFYFFGTATIAPVVGTVMPHSVAEEAGIKVGDRIRAINGEQILDFDRLPQIVSLSAGQNLAIEIQRGATTLVVHATPRLTHIKDPLQGDANAIILGVRPPANPKVTLIQYGPLQALGAAVGRVWLIVHGTVSTVWQMVAGYTDMSQLRGPVGMAGLAQKVAAIGFFSLIQLAAIFSVSIGFINLFPIPMLDGGHLLYYACEAVLGRPLGERAQDVGYRLGLAAVLCLVLLVTWNDLVRLNLF